MNSGDLMIVLIVAVVMIASVARAKYGYGRHGRRNSEIGPAEHAENLRLRDEIKELKERIKVIERITVEKENSLAKEIESLRDR